MMLLTGASASSSTGRRPGSPGPHRCWQVAGLAALGLASALWVLPAAAQSPAPAAPIAPPARSPAPPPLGEVKALGQDRFQIGRIVVDKRARNFTVPGRVNVFDKPLEYLAGSPGSRKGYETLLELDASGSEFNLACILIGLERDPDLPPSKPPGGASQDGPRVALSLAWGAAGQRRQLSAAQALFNPQGGAGAESIDWIYTGSFSSRDGSQFAADRTGALIGFIHDPTTVIKAKVAVGVGAYGSVRGNPALPPVGAAIELIVEAAPASK